ncbi:unnamed protein product [Orchesella dallaii]|uniref:Activating molecule in BECN1-regulated autophagy protein 1 n=1 Tax=Orchesella dallaii TaxID=48710 RepID=A0ABP1RE20_9HEXA
MDIKEPREDRRKDPIPGEYGYPIPRELFYRELGFGFGSSVSSFYRAPRHNIGKKIVSQSLATKAVHTLCTKELTRRRFKLPNGARTTFHIAFSADGSKVASCHGDHNVYVCDVASGEVVQTLVGHPRTPWCVVFHPTQNDVLASGCLAGHVRVWDLKGGSELLVTDSGTVIASLAFHPTVRLLAIATFNEIIFWDWGHPYPLARCSTENTKEKVRLVRFDRLGRSLITGITNFPSPPCREDVRRTVRGGSSGGSFFRPNILSRNSRSRRATQTFAAGAREDLEDAEDVSMVGEGDVVEEVVVPVPDPVADDPEAFIAAATAAAEEESMIVGEALNNRQDRFQESYRQLVSHYEELVSNYQQFLRSRIPRILEDSNNVASRRTAALDEALRTLEVHNPEPNLSQLDNYETDGLTITAPGIENDSSVETLRGSSVDSPSSPSPVATDDEVPGPSRLIFETTPVRATDSTDTDGSNDESLPTSTNQTSAADAATTPTGARSDSDLRSIEALAQNILEMQNLCSQVRMDAPLAVENQHIMELRVIRRHLELLQEQTRELQSSIRATLNSLATGSLAALRSHVANATNVGHNPESREALPNPFVSLDQLQASQGSAPHDFSNPSPPPSPVSRPVVQNTEGPHVNTDTSRRVRVENVASASRSNGSASSSNGNNTLYRIMITTPSPFSESGRGPNPHMLNRIRVPPMVAMQYEIADAITRNQPGPSRNPEQPVPGTSRDSIGNNGRGRETPGPRRIVREFHLVSGRPGSLVAEEHARHCPFSGRDPYHWRPPPRMRSLYDMGEMPSLIVWPTMETGLDTSIRNFREVTPPVRRMRNPLSSLTITVRNAGDNAFSSSSVRNAPFMNFSQWLITGGFNVGSLTSDVLVGIYLTIRQLNGSNNSSEDASQSEQWQHVFGNVVPGLALIPPSLRQGHRHHQPHRCQHRRRRTHWICYNHNSPSHTSRPCSIGPRGSGGNNATDDSSVSNNPPASVPSSSSIRTCASASRPNASQEEPVPCSSTSNSSSSTDSGSGGTKNSSSASSYGRTIPAQLERNFTRVFYIRASDELIPVYSTVNSSETVLGTEVRESLQASVYYLPIGLFLQGGPWEANTQTIGIHWPPVTREEEYAILDLRVSERPLIVYESDTRESFPNRRYPRIRIDYDQTSLRVTLPTGFSLHFIQSGITLLDCISTSINLPRPRPIEGRLWIDYLGPFLDALERMFGLRHSRRLLGSIPSAHRGGAFMGRTPPWVHAGNVRPSLFSASPPSSTAATSGTDSHRQASTSNSATTSRERLPVSIRRGDVSERLRTMTRRIITLAPDAQVDSRRRFYEDNPMILSHGYMYGNDNSGPSGTGGSSGNYRASADRDRRFYYRQRLRHEHSQEASQGELVRENPDGRFIRYAVDTAASELLRRQHHADESGNGLPLVEAGSAGLSAMGRPVESRIERVLNERGNRGAHSSSPPGSEESHRNRMRLEEIQMRISVLSQWSRARAMATSGTQTPQSFVRGTWPSAERQHQNGGNTNLERTGNEQLQVANAPTPSSSSSINPPGSSSVDPRFSRRRPYSRIARLVRNDIEDISDDEVLVSVPSRMPRLSDQSSLEPERIRPERSEIPSREAGRGGSIRHHFDHWVLRSNPSNPVVHRYRPSAVLELAGSARTRAPPVNRYSGDNVEQPTVDLPAGAESLRSRLRRSGSSRATGSVGGQNNDGNNNNVGNGNEDQHADGAARFYPGYIPEILITPRTRPPTYFTMDAATTAFLSSRIQKWDFSEFLIPDITKRDEFVVVRECSLHSDACLDVSADSEFLAVLQPSDNGSYSSVGIYSLRDDSLGDILNVYHFDQNTVSVSISPSCDYMIVAYAGRGPLYRFVHPSRNIGKILSLARDEEGIKLVPVKDLYADGQVAFMSINCMHWVPVAGYGIIYGTNTGDLVLLS